MNIPKHFPNNFPSGDMTVFSSYNGIAVCRLYNIVYTYYKFCSEKVDKQFLVLFLKDFVWWSS